MRLLYLTSRLPFPPIGGDRLRTFAFIKYLSRKNKLDLVSLYDSNSELNNLPALSSYCENITLFKRNKLISAINLLKTFINRYPFQVNYYSYNPIRSHLLSVYKNYNCIIVHLLRMAEYVRDLEIKKIIDMTDCLSESWKSQSNHFKEPLRSFFIYESGLLRSYELNILQAFDKLLFVTESDAKKLTAAPNEKIMIVKNGLNIAEKNDQDKGKRRYIGFMGKLNTIPNSFAVDYFIRWIFPHIRKRLPDIEFLIIGQNPSRKWGSQPGCVVAGDVPDVTDFLKMCLVFVSPLRSGAGFKNKIVEAMLMKVPVVATSVSVEGMGFENGRHIILSDDPHGFADKVVELINNRELNSMITENAYKFVKDNFDWLKELEKVDKILCTTT